MMGGFAQNGDYSRMNNMHQWMSTTGARSVHNIVWGGLAETLGLTPDELNAELASGKTLAQIAAGSPAEIKRQTMPGQVLELAPDDAARAVQALRAARDSGCLPLDEVALYGSLVHVVAPGVAEQHPAIAAELLAAGVQPGAMAMIEPSLEDVFIACMR